MVTYTALEEAQIDSNVSPPAAEAFLRDLLPGSGRRILDSDSEDEDGRSTLSATDGSGESDFEGSEDEDDPFDWAEFDWEMFMGSETKGNEGPSIQFARDAAAGTSERSTKEQFCLESDYNHLRDETASLRHGNMSSVGL